MVGRGQLPDHAIVVIVRLTTVHHCVASISKLISLVLLLIVAEGVVGHSAAVIGGAATVVRSAVRVLNLHQVGDRHVDLALANAHLKRCRLAIDVCDSTALTLELTSDHQHDLVEHAVTLNAILIGHCRHVPRLVVAQELMALEYQVRELLSKDAIRPIKEGRVGQEHGAAANVPYDALLILVFAVSLALDHVVYLDSVAHAVADGSPAVSRHQLVDLVTSDVDDFVAIRHDLH